MTAAGGSAGRSSWHPKFRASAGWVGTDPEALADVGPIPAGETIIEIPEDVLTHYLRNKTGEER
jgi:hypothetical protein